MIDNLVQYIQEAEKNFASKTAVKDLSGTSFSYSELVNSAKHIAGSITAANCLVAIHLEKSSYYLSSIYAILLSGNTYIPLDVNSPIERYSKVVNDEALAFIITSKDSPIIDFLTSQSISFSYKEIDQYLILISLESTAHVNPNLAYVLYTSGSTGEPKGVELTHENAICFVNWCKEEFNTSSKDIFSSHAPFHFDLSILDIFVSLASGGCLILFNSKESKNPKLIIETIRKEAITIWYSTPTTLRLMLEFGKIDEKAMNSLRLVLFAGEVFPISTARKLQSFLRSTQLYNLYGPTETNVCTYYKCPQDFENLVDEIPIGKPCPYAEVKIDGDNDHGELLVSGKSVANGYRKLSEETKNKFASDQNNKRWYKTGDIVQMLPSKHLLFKGRVDGMIKRNGYRIELGEIEAGILKHPLINNTIVIPLKDSSGLIRLYATYTTENGSKLSLIELKTHLSKVIPVYMIPDTLIWFTSFPVTTTNKIDRQAIKQKIMDEHNTAK